jgi:hypothetical protein
MYRERCILVIYQKRCSKQINTVNQRFLSRRKAVPRTGPQLLLAAIAAD